LARAEIGRIEDVCCRSCCCAGGCGGWVGADGRGGGWADGWARLALYGAVSVTVCNFLLMLLKLWVDEPARFGWCSSHCRFASPFSHAYLPDQFY
jgi:hypothetical protein